MSSKQARWGEAMFRPGRNLMPIHEQTLIFKVLIKTVLFFGIPKAPFTANYAIS
jgi:hypothetical protein